MPPPPRRFLARRHRARLVWLVVGALAAIFAASATPAAAAAPTAPPAGGPPVVGIVEPRIWSCEFVSAALGRAMRFLVVLPEGYDLEGTRLPVIYFLHGRGRHERSLLENPETRRVVLATAHAVVLPRGGDGWYVNSPVIPADRYADYLDEVISLAEQHFPIATTPASRAIGGWSMGGYGTLYTATRRAGDFIAAASIIGIIDYPRREIPNSNQNYKLQPRFGTDPTLWPQLNPRLLLPRLHRDGRQLTELFIAYADQASDRQMNEAFIASARELGLTVDTLLVPGAHTFPVVQACLPPVFRFLSDQLTASATAQKHP